MKHVVEAATRKFGRVLACVETEQRTYATFYKLIILRDEPAIKYAPYMTITAREDEDQPEIDFMHGRCDLLEATAKAELKNISFAE